MLLKRENIMTRKCIGCGAAFQSESKSEQGYVNSKVIDTASYCERCFKVIHYGEAKVISKSVDIENFINEVNNMNVPILYLLDVSTISNETLSVLRQVKGRVYVILTKRDLIPKSVKDKKLIEYIRESVPSVEEVFVVSSTRKWNIDVLYNFLCKNVRKCYVLGHTNSGKSSLINSFLELKGKKAYITTSPVPNTTEEVMNIKLDENLTIIDTPGFINYRSIVNFMDINEYKKVIPKKEIKPKIYKLRPGFMIIVEDFLRIENNSDELIDLIFYLKNELNYRKMKIETRNDLKILEKVSIEIKDDEDIVIEGLGFIKVPKPSKLTIYTLDGQVLNKRRKMI